MPDPFAQDKTPRRPLRIASEILKLLPDLLRRHVRLPDDLFVSIVGVEVTNDLSWAKVFFSVVGEDEDRKGKRAEKLLNERKGILRKEIAARMVMRQHPQLRFIHDKTAANAARIEQLLKQINDERGGESSTP